MSHDYSKSLNPEKALIWRIVHRDNIPCILDQGLACSSGTLQCPDWVPIGNAELISKRAEHAVPLSPFGCLSDYVPFYFTPFSPMLLNILSGRGVTKRSHEEIVILVSSLRRVSELGLHYVFTDMHAYYHWASFYNDLADLAQLDWALLQARDFRRDFDDPQKFERYQAEALIHEHCPTEALFGMICYDFDVEQQLKHWLAERKIEINVYARPEWFF